VGTADRAVEVREKFVVKWATVPAVRACRAAIRTIGRVRKGEAGNYPRPGSLTLDESVWARTLV
jgi:hypothetical protein